MLDNCVGNKQWKFSTLHQIGQQKSVFSSGRGRIKYTPINICSDSSNGEPGSVQVADATVRLKQVILKRNEPQFFRSSNDSRAISAQAKLKTTVLGMMVDGRTKLGETVCLKFAVRVDKQQKRAFGDLSSSISGGGNSGMSFPDDRQRVTADPVANEFRSLFFAAVVHDNDFKAGAIVLVVEGLEALIKRSPIVVNPNDNAEERR